MEQSAVQPAPKGIILAASASNSGKTTLSLGLQRLLRRTGRAVAPAKCGPDYIDPAFHSVASGRASLNLDPWAMSPQDIRYRACNHAANNDLLFVEGVMGLFDGAAGGAGSTANLAKILGLPVLLVLDVKGQAQTAAALALGLNQFDPDVNIAGVLLNRVGSIAHESLLRQAFDSIHMPVVGAIRVSDTLSLPSRHLGLVQAQETSELTAQIDAIADHMAPDLDLDTISGLCSVVKPAKNQRPNTLAPLGKHIAIARDAAFSFCYPHILQDWREQGSDVSFFSPLRNEEPDMQADAIYLPGGYPELHLDTLGNATKFRAAMKGAAKAGKPIFGECGGYMVLGEQIIGKDGKAHTMLGLLPHSTDFSRPKLSLGYRKLSHSSQLPWPENLMAHEFHYATICQEGEAKRLFAASNASGRQLTEMGMQRGNVMGSFAHIIAPDH